MKVGTFAGSIDRKGGGDKAAGGCEPALPSVHGPGCSAGQDARIQFAIQAAFTDGRKTNHIFAVVTEGDFAGLVKYPWSGDSHFRFEKCHLALRSLQIEPYSGGLNDCSHHTTGSASGTSHHLRV